ncbi:glutathione S-transferase family protein [Sphingobium sp. B11D3D]|uniref:glutathione S-transferase family protein n=1 Tax=Sphingobium sp. B11D3D TaxID=2940576 RepID=UPI0022258991|nr:glutathione S-transferase family protein [Sphingobium sp. B11D3D]MCW2370841.1 glutathione S-transferase [Sphingobium sp. B11D3D]
MTQTNPIRIYDLNLVTGATISPFCWQAKYAVAHKGLEAEMSEGGFTSLSRRTGGRTDFHPGISDGDTWVFESLRSGDFVVADYLDRTYPDRPMLFRNPDHHNYVKFLDTWLWATAIKPWFHCYILDYHDLSLPEDRPYVRESRERDFLGGRTLEDAQAGREERLPLVVPQLEPLREVLRERRWLGGEAPDFADYSALSIFLWAASVAKTPPLPEDDFLRDWYERGCDLFGGIGRHPGLHSIFGLKMPAA